MLLHKLETRVGENGGIQLPDAMKDVYGTEVVLMLVNKEQAQRHSEAEFKIPALLAQGTNDEFNRKNLYEKQ